MLNTNPMIIGALVLSIVGAGRSAAYGAMATPSTRLFTSATGALQFRAVPVDYSHGTGSLFTKAPDGAEKPIWQKSLVNMPQDALVYDRTLREYGYVITLGNWDDSAGHEVVIYNPHGDVVRDLSARKLYELAGVPYQPIHLEPTRVVTWKTDVVFTFPEEPKTPTLKMAFKGNRALLIDLPTGDITLPSGDTVHTEAPASKPVSVLTQPDPKPAPLVPAVGISSAGMIGIGLDWRKNVFVQEFVQDGKPHYTIFNGNPKAVTMTVREWPRVRTGDQLLGPGPRVTDEAPQDKTPKVAAGPWEVPANGMVQEDVTDLIGKGLLEFTLADGTSLGLLNAPVVTDHKLFSFDGLNGSGGRHNDLWIEQYRASFNSGDYIDLILMIPTNSGIVTFFKKPQDSNLTTLPLLSATCGTLAIDTDDKGIHIDTGKPVHPAIPLHTVFLRFKAPQVQAPTLVMVNGWVDQPNGGGFGITRGIVVQP